MESRRGKVHLGGVSLESVAEKHGTPVFVTDERRIRENCQRFTRAFSRHWKFFRAYYALKANSNLAIVSVLRQEGAGADCSCIQELQVACLAKFDVDDMLYTGAYNSDEELKFASQLGVTINLDDASLLDRLAKFKLPERLSFRINPGFGKAAHDKVLCAGPESKFGISDRVAVKAYARAKALGVRRFGIHMMAGSGVLDSGYFARVTDRLFEIASEVSRRTGVEFEFVDIGGGFGIPYEPGERPLDIERVAKDVAARFRERFERVGSPIYLFAEPGRYLVADSTVLLTRVHATKKVGAKRFVGVDAGMNTLIRPALYDSYHEILLVGGARNRRKERATVVGPICENGDIIARDRMMPAVKEGDLLAVMDAGAYGFSMSSNYNSRPRAAEVLVNDGEEFLIREREGIADILDRQRIPGRLLR